MGSSLPQVDPTVGPPTEARPESGSGMDMSFEASEVKNHRIILTLDDDDLDTCEEMLFNLFNSYLQPDSILSAEEAARCLDAMLPENRPDTPEDPDDDKELTIGFMRGLVDFIFIFARQIPHHHNGQDKLVQLLQALKRRPVTSFCQSHGGLHERPVWKNDLWEGWTETYRHAFADQPSSSGPQQGKTREQECTEYINLCAFAARLEAAEVMPYGLYHSIESITDVIDFNKNTILYRCHPDIGACRVQAGAQWIVHAGEWLWGHIRWGHYPTIPSEGTLRWSPKEWAAIMLGFREVKTDNQDARLWATRAAAMMQKIMTDNGYSVEMMLAWNPEEQSIHDDIYKDLRYAHLFKTRKQREKEAAEEAFSGEQ